MSTTRRGVLSKLHGVRRIVAILMVGAMSPFVFGCFGEFPLTRLVYKLNDSVHPGVLSQVVFWVFVILPVYSIATLADALVFNLIEFWTGAKIDVSTAQAEDGTTYVLAPSKDGREAVLTMTRDGRQTGQIRFVRRDDGQVEVRDADGRLAGKVLPDGSGGFVLTDASGKTVSTVSATDLPSLASLAGR